MKLRKIILYFAVLAVIFFGFGLIASQVHAQDITLEWDANTEPNLVGYNIYESEFGSNAGSQWVKIGVANNDETEFTAAGRDDYKSYAYQVTALNDQGNESFVSNMAYTQNVPGSPVNVRVIVNVNQ